MGSLGKTGPTLVGDIDAEVFMNTLRVNTLRYDIVPKHLRQVELTRVVYSLL